MDTRTKWDHAHASIMVRFRLDEDAVWFQRHLVEKGIDAEGPSNDYYSDLDGHYAVTWPIDIYARAPRTPYQAGAEFMEASGAIVMAWGQPTAGGARIHDQELVAEEPTYNTWARQSAQNAVQALGAALHDIEEQAAWRRKPQIGTA